MASAALDWEISQSDPELSSILDRAFRQVLDPELGLNLMELGLIREVSQEGEALHLTMILTTPFCPYGPMLVDETRRAAEDASAMIVDMQIGAEVWDAKMMEDDLAAEWGLL